MTLTKAPSADACEVKENDRAANRSEQPSGRTRLRSLEGMCRGLGFRRDRVDYIREEVYEETLVNELLWRLSNVDG